MTWQQFLYVYDIHKIWPDIETAPKFLQPEYRRLMGPLNALLAREKERTSQSDPSKVSSHG